MTSYRDRLRLQLEARAVELFLRTALGFGKAIYEHKEHYQTVLEQCDKVLLGIWHGQIMGGVYLLRNRGIHAIVGRHRDAELAGRVASRFGYHLIRGSSRDGGSKALTRALEVIEKPGTQLAITCDGPIGPYRKAKSGIAVIAHRTGVPVVPLGVNGSRKKVITTSWDNFYVHLPFGKNVMIFGEPIYPDRYAGADPVAALLSDIEHRLNRVQELADSYFTGK